MTLLPAALTTEQLRAIALEVADELNEVKREGRSFSARDNVIDDYAVRFALRFLAAIPEKAEPVAWETPVAGLIQYVTESKYQKFTDAIKRYYRPHIKPSQIPSDMVLVPREPTQDMLIAAWNTSRVGRCPEDDIATYRAMIAAAPKGE